MSDCPDKLGPGRIRFWMNVLEDILATTKLAVWDTSCPLGKAWGLFSPPFAKLVCTQMTDVHWLADALHPFEIMHAVLGTGRLKLIVLSVATLSPSWWTHDPFETSFGRSPSIERPRWHMIRFKPRSGVRFPSIIRPKRLVNQCFTFCDSQAGLRRLVWRRKKKSHVVGYLWYTYTSSWSGLSFSV